MNLIKNANGNLPRSRGDRDIMIQEAAEHYGKFLTALGFDWRADANTQNTPYRVAKAWIDDLILGCVSDPPNITAFPNTDGYTGLVCEANIKANSMCSHHNLPFIGKAHVAYIPGTNPEDKVIGLSKLNRIVHWFAARPQLQESLTKQIHDYLDKMCVGNRGVAVVVEAEHMCVKCRGVKDDSQMITSQLSGYFFSNEVGTRTELFNLIHRR